MANPVLGAIEEHMDAPTARGLATAVGRTVGAGRLVDGDRLPPIRTVAAQLGLSPTTVSAAWGLLARAGTVRTDGRRGTVVTARSVGPARYRGAVAGGRLFALDLSTGTPDPTLLPDVSATLRRIAPPPEPATYLDDPVLPELGELLRADWPFPAERITVVDGAMDALQLIAATFLRIGDLVGVEDPCFPPLLDLLDSVGATPVPIALDDDGPLPDSLAAAVRAGARIVVLQPRGQNPTGACTTVERASELSKVLRGNDTLVVEDDSVGAIAATAPLSLGVHLPQRTLHVRSYSKSHGPDLRLAALGGPATLVDPVTDRRFLGQGWTSRLLQRVLVDLLTEPDAIRAVAHARDEYAHRRAAIFGPLRDAGIPVAGRDGLNIWMPVADEDSALLLLATRGIGAAAGRAFAVRPGSPPHLRVTTALLAGGFDEIAGALADAARVGPRGTVR